MNSVDQQTAFVLKTINYKESSFISQVFSQEYGVLSIISKGARAKTSKIGSSFKPFQPLLLSWRGKSELKTLTQVEPLRQQRSLQGQCLYCGFYLNELILNFLHKHDPHPMLFAAFMQTMEQLSLNNHVEASLRQFEKVLLEEIGYGLVLECDARTGEMISPEKFYYYELGVGAYEAEQQAGSEPRLAKCYSGKSLLNLQANCLVQKTQLREAKVLMRVLIDHQLDGKILKSRELFI